MRKIARQLRGNIALREVGHYLLAMGFTFVFALFCSARVGWFLFGMMAFAPALSILAAWGCSKAVSFEVNIPKNVYRQGESGEMELVFHNKVPFLSSLLHLVVITSDGVDLAQAKGKASVEYDLTIGWTREEEKSFSLEAYSAGEASLTIESVELFDVFHLVSFSVLTDKKPRRISFGVLPQIRELPENANCRQTIRLVAADSEPDEDSVEKSTNQFGGFPGFDHRQYLPGDPVKRINWKLSAKKRELYVRLDEMQGGSGVSVILDPYCGLDAGRRCAARGASIEDALSYSAYFLQNDLSVQFYWFGRGGWERRTVAELKHLDELCEELAWFRFADEIGDRIPDAFALDDKCKACVYCTTFQDDRLCGILEEVRTRQQCSVMVSSIAQREGWCIG
ncbi:MAG: DUF58 domain-containing protein [Acetatifactor sp.]